MTRQTYTAKRGDLLRWLKPGVPATLLDEFEESYAARLAYAILAENPDRSDEWSDGVEWAAWRIDPEVTL